MINDDKFEKIKQDIEGSLIELVDEGYKVMLLMVLLLATYIGRYYSFYKSKRSKTR
jgi:hypothetical protein